MTETNGYENGKTERSEQGNDRAITTVDDFVEMYENDRNTGSRALGAYFRDALDHTEEREQGEVTLFGLGDDKRLNVTISVPILSKIPLLGKLFTRSFDMTGYVAAAILFGELWEQEYPVDRDEKHEAAVLLRRLAAYAEEPEPGISTGAGSAIAENARHVAASIDPDLDPEISE
jgi:hypothetical protein